MVCRTLAWCLTTLAILALPSAAAAGDDADTLALVGVAVVDVEQGVVIPGQTIVIEGGTIVAVTDDGAAVPEGATRIDVSGLYAVPGLIDSHVHYMTPEVTHPMMVAHGIAFVRDMGGYPAQTLALRDEMNEGGTRSPRMLAVGPIVDGNPPIWPFSEICETPEDGRAAVRKLAAMGVDQIKVYSRLEREVYLAIADEARAQGLAMVGHVPLAVDVNDAIAAGHATIEHLTGFDGLLAARLDPTMGGSRNFVARSRAWAMLEPLTDADLAEIAEPFAAGGVVQCPTLVVMQGIVDYAASADDPMLRYVPANMRQFWANGNYAEYGRAMKAQVPGMQRFVGVLHRAGVPIVAGTDLGNPNVIAGYSLHKELELLVASGLTPVEALRCATTTPAALFGLNGPGGLGTIVEGGEATLLLVDANPLDDIAATQSINAVVHRGEYLDRAALDELLADAERAASGESEAVDSGFDLLTLEMPGEPIASGVYTLTFGAFAAGTESFRITRADSVYHLAVHNQPKGGGQAPYALTIKTDAEGRFAEATHTTLGDTPIASRYWREGDTLIAESEGARQELQLTKDALVSGPAMASDFCTLNRLEMAAGESRVYQGFSFGFPNWKWSTVANTVTRLPDETVEAERGPETLRMFRQSMDIPGFGLFEVTSVLDRSGVPVRATTEMPFGSMEATRGPLESATPEGG
ncbi:MAG: amidohydrolase family protein [Phycisphaerales bacterium JB054]